MNNWGLLTRRENGADVLTPGVFTMRFVTSFPVGGASAYLNLNALRRSSPTLVANPLVTAGMLAICTCADSAPMDEPNRKAGWGGVPNYPYFAVTPGLRCYNGGVELFRPSSSAFYTTNIYVYVFEYV